MKRLFVIIAFLMLSAAAFSATYSVPGSFPSIQAGLSSATVVSGDTIIVKPGMYMENINFYGKDILLKSLQGPKATVINGGNFGTVVSFVSGETSKAVIDGFTIKNGSGTPSGLGYSFGGGILCLKSSPTIQNNIIRSNYVDATNLDEGGGIHVEAYSNPRIISNLMFKNHASSYGGCISVNDHCSPVIVNNVIYGNVLFKGGCGAGISCRNTSKMIITNNSLVYNEVLSQGKGGGLYIAEGSKTIISNTIFWNNMADIGREMWIGTTANNSSVDIRYSDVKGGPSTYIYVDPACILTWGAGMISLDPLFAPIGIESHLTWNSPCRDVGDVNAPELPKLDMEGDPRNFKGVDIGADEFYRHLWYPDEAHTGGGTTLVFADLPGSAPVALALSFTGFFDPPLPTVWGDWYPMFPIVGPIFFPAIPASGILGINVSIPGTPPGPYSIYMQAGINMVLTNPCIMYVN